MTDLRCTCGAVATRRLTIEEQDLTGTCAAARYVALLCLTCAELLGAAASQLKEAREQERQRRIRALERELDALQRGPIRRGIAGG